MFFMIVTKIIQLMTIPLVQGLLSSMLELNEFGPRDTIKGRALAYGAALLPILDYCNPENAELIYSNLPVDDGPMGSFIVVKNALEASYDCMGITCDRAPCIRMDCGEMRDCDLGGSDLWRVRCSKIQIVWGWLLLLFRPRGRLTEISEDATVPNAILLVLELLVIIYFTLF